VAQDAAITKTLAAPAPSVDSGRPDKPPVTDSGPDREVDKQYWERCLSDAERAEQNWRRRGREIVQIYRNEGPGTSSPKSVKNAGGSYFNILFANTEVMLPAVYSKPPTPVVKSRFIQSRKLVPVMPPQMPVMPPPMPGPVGGPPGPPGGPESLPPGPPPVAPPSPGPPLDGGAPGGLGPPTPQPGPPGLMDRLLPPTPPGAEPVPSFIVKQPPGPRVEDIDTAAAVMEKALEIVLTDEASHEAVKSAVKDVMLPGRGLCRVRWNPKIVDVPLPGGPLPDGTAPTQSKKVWETTNTEYVYWEDFLCDPVRQDVDKKWVAFRHLFTGPEMQNEFAGNPDFDRLVALGKIDTLLLWTEESAAKSPPSGGGYSKSASQLGDVIKKCMVWEIWDRTDPANPRVIWFVRDSGSLVLRVDPDSLQLSGFFPVPAAMLSISTSDSRIPRPFYDFYSRLGEDLESTSVSISNLTRQIKVRGAYNSASTEIADLLKADNNKMIPVDGVDMINGGLQNHIWLVPIDQWMAALDKLLMARESQKQSIYEIMGISDIMRGATKASETATAQRIKGQMGTVRLQDLKTVSANFARDLVVMMAEIIAKNFDAETLSRMTGEDVTPAVFAIIRDDFLRTCSIDIETDSTVEVDEQTAQQSMAQTMQAIQAVFAGVQPLMMMGLPPPMIVQLSLAMLRMALQPIRNSRGVVQLLDQFEQQLQSAMAMAPPPMIGAPAAGGPPAPPGGPPAGPIKEPGGPRGAGPRPGTMNGPPPPPDNMQQAA